MSIQITHSDLGAANANTEMITKSATEPTNSAPAMPPTTKGGGKRKKRQEQCAAVITLALAVIFVLLLLVNWRLGKFTNFDYSDRQLVDDSVDAMDDFARFTCPAHYRMLAAYKEEQRKEAAMQFESPIAAPSGAMAREMGAPVMNGTSATASNGPTSHAAQHHFSEVSDAGAFNIGPKKRRIAASSSLATCASASRIEGTDGREQQQPGSEQSSTGETQTEKFGREFLALCEQARNLRGESAVSAMTTFGPQVLNAWKTFLDKMFKSVGGFRYAELSNQKAVSAHQVWRVAGRLERELNFYAPIIISVTYDELSDQKIWTLKPSTYQIPADYLAMDTNSTEFRELWDQLKLEYFGQLSAIAPLVMEGTHNKTLTDDEVVEYFYNVFLEQAVAYIFDMARMQPTPKGDGVDRRKFSEVQRTSIAEFRNSTLTVANLVKRFPNIDWLAFFEGMGMKVANDSLVVLEPGNADFFRLVNNHFGSATAIRNLRAAQVITTIQRIYSLRSLGCTEFLDANMPHVKAFQYIKQFGREERERNIYEVQEMVKPIVAEYRAAIGESDWLTEASKQNLLKKLQMMDVNIGWPSWYDPDGPLNGSQLTGIDKYHRPWFEAINREVEDLTPVTEGNFTAQFDATEAKFMRAMLAVAGVSAQIALGTRTKSSAEVMLAPNVQNAQYVRTTNSFSVAYSWIQKFFDSEQMVESYGKIGHTIAHEIGHAFDNNGMLRNWLGVLDDQFLDAQSTQKFDEIQQCVVERYANECCPLQARDFSVIHCADGWLTQSENFADISGVTIAYRAFKRRQSVLGGGHFGMAKRKFWVAYANLWCDTPFTDASFLTNLLTDVHPPAECRINVVTRSVPQFSRDFGIDEKYISKQDTRRCFLWLERAPQK